MALKKYHQNLQLTQPKEYFDIGVMNLINYSVHSCVLFFFFLSLLLSVHSFVLEYVFEWHSMIRKDRVLSHLKKLKKEV